MNKRKVRLVTQSVALGITVLSLTIPLLMRPRVQYGDEDGMGTARETRKLPNGTQLQVEARYPMQLKVHDESELSVTVGIEPSTRTEHEVTISTLSSGLTIRPATPITTSMTNLAGVSFILSAETAGRKLLSVKMESKDFGETEMNALWVRVDEEVQWLPKVAMVAQNHFRFIVCAPVTKISAATCRCHPARDSAPMKS